MQKKLENFTDVRTLQHMLENKGMKIINKVDKSLEGPASFLINDPDGNPILFDQHV
jgi:hypothetical protein